MGLAITPIYGAALVALYITLSFRVIFGRRAARVSLGDGGDATLMRRIRAHGNCAEYLPLGLVVLMMAELSGAPGAGLHLAGMMLLAGRLFHAIALSGSRLPPKPAFALRGGGMILTLASLALSAGLALF